jgi:AcrR family transcriptional regulator
VITLTQTAKDKARAAKRKQIVQAAIETFMDRDYSQVKMEEIAESAGVGKGTVYEYFRSKEELFFESITQAVEAYIALFNRYFKASASCWDNLRNLMYVQLIFLQENRSWVRFLYSERPIQVDGLEQWFMERRLRLIQAIEGLIIQGVKDGEIRTGINTEMAARSFNALHYIVMGGMIALDGIEITEKHIDALMDIFWKGVGEYA